MGFKSASRITAAILLSGLLGFSSTASAGGSFTQNFTCANNASLLLTYYSHDNSPQLNWCSVYTVDRDGSWYDELLDGPSLQACVDMVVEICNGEPQTQSLADVATARATKIAS